VGSGVVAAPWAASFKSRLNWFKFPSEEEYGLTFVRFYLYLILNLWIICARDIQLVKPEANNMLKADFTREIEQKYNNLSKYYTEGSSL